MEVFFIRHGQTEGNRKRIHQTPDTPLNDRGRAQAAAVAPRVRDLQPTHFLASPYARAKGTAEIIAAELGIEPTYKPIFVEVLRPRSIQGKRYHDPRSIFYMIRWFFTGKASFTDESRGESYLALIERAHRAQDFLETLPADARVVVVSHSVFINFFVEHICRDTPIGLWGAFMRFTKIQTLDNSSITHVRYHADASPGVCKWEVVKFDDDSHIKKEYRTT